MKMKKSYFLIGMLILLLTFTLVGCKSKYTLTLNDSDKEITLAVGASKQIYPTVTDGVTLVWETSDSSVATVENGVIKGVSIGNATITVSIKDESKYSATIAVKVEEAAFSPVSLETVLTTYANNDAVNVEGVVYGVVSNGFYVADSDLGYAFVVMGSSWEANVKVGDKVQIVGRFGYVSNYPQIKTVTSVKVVSSGNNSEMVAVEGTVADINNLSRTAKVGSYGKLYTITATVGKNTANIYTLTDDDNNTCFFNSNSNVDVIATYLNTRITLNVIVHSYSTTENCWLVSFTGESSDVEKTPISFDTLVEYAKADIEGVVPTTIYGALSLPSNHSTISYLKYTWSVEANEFVSITNNVATVKYDESDHKVTLKVEITDGTESTTVEYVITSKAIVERSISSLDDGDLVINYSVVLVRGTIVGFDRNQSITIRSLIIQDPTTLETITVDFNKTSSDGILTYQDTAFTNLKLGDEILVTGEYRNVSRVTIMDPISVEVVSSDNKYTHNFENAYVLNDQASYDELGLNVDKYINQLVKIDNPFLNFSTSSAPSETNWVRFGYDETIGNTGFGESGSRKYFAFLIAAQNETLGTTSWYDMYDIPNVSGPAEQFGLTIYAYVVYISDTYLAFVIPDSSCYITSGIDQIKLELNENIPTSVENGTITLPTTATGITGNISWSSDNSAINVETGVVTASETENIVVKLTASFTYEGESFELVFEVTVLKSAAMTVSEVLEKGIDSNTVKLSGVICAYVADGNDSESRMGVLLMDSETKELLMVCGLSNIGGSYGAYVDSEGKTLKVGDEILVVGTYYLNTVAIGSGPVQTNRNYVNVSATDSISLVSSDNSVAYGDAAITITNNDELAAFAADPQYGVLVKITGTKENPICLGGSSTSLPFNIKLFMNASATSNDEVKYSGRVFTMKTSVNAINSGSDTWYQDLLGIDGAFVGPNASQAPLKYVGDMYIVLGYQTGSYFQTSIVNLDNWSLAQYANPEDVDDLLIKDLPTSINYGDLTLELPTTHTLVDGTITWVSSNTDIIDLTNKTVAYLDSDTEVTLTGSYKIDGVDYSCEYTVTVLKTATKAEVETELFANIPASTNVGSLLFTLCTSATDVETVVWTSSNSEVLNVETMTALEVTKDTVVTLTATYTLRGVETTSTIDITVSYQVSLDDVKKALVIGYLEKVRVGALGFTLNTTNDNIEGTVTWTSDSPSFDCDALKVLDVTEDTLVTLTGAFVFKGEAQTVTYQLTIIGPYTVSELLDETEDEVYVKVTGIIVGYQSDGNTNDTSVAYMGVILMDSTTKELISISGLSSLGGSYGAYVASNSDALAIGDEITLTGTYYLNSPKSYDSGADMPGKQFVMVSSTDSVTRNSQNNTITFGEATVTITNNTEMANFASNLQYGVLIKIVGTTENPICVGGSASKLPFNIKIFMNSSATVNDDTKYNGLTFALKSSVNNENGGNTTWYKDLFAIDGAFVGPKAGVSPIKYTGEMYVVVTFTTSAYHQMSVVNASNWTLTKVE